MELKTHDTTHFIQTIKGGLVQKVRNRTSNGRPFIRSKYLKDIYESEDEKRLQNPPSGLVFEHQQVNHESPCFLVAHRTLRQVKHEIVEFSPHADDDFGSGPDDGTTLEQLRKRLLTKKRKRITIDEDSQKEGENEKAGQDDSDLNEPLINWKSKRSIVSKAKRKRLKVCSISSLTIDTAIKSEENLVSECSPQVGGKVALVSRVKVEYPDAEPLRRLNKISSGEASSVGQNEVSNLGQKRVLNEYNTDPPLCLTVSETSVTNQINYADLEDDVPMSVLFSRGGTSVEFNTPESACKESVDLPSVEVEKQRENHDSHGESLFEESNAALCNHSRSSSIAEDTPEESYISGSQVPDMAIDGCMRFHQDCNPKSVDLPSVEVEKQRVNQDSLRESLSEESNADLCNHSKSSSSVEDMPEESYISGSQVPDMAIDGCVRFHQDCNSESVDLPSVEVEKQREIQDSHRESLSEEPNADLRNHSRSSSSAEDMPEERYISGSQVPDMASDGCVRFNQECHSKEKNEPDFTNEPNNSQSSLDNTCGPNLVSITPSKTIADTELPSACFIVRNGLNCLGHIEDELVKAVDKQNSTLTTTEASSENMPCGSAETILSPETHQTSERLLSSRKAFSPSSQEQLRLAMKSDEVCNDSNRNIVLECKEKLFENQSEKNGSSPRSNIQNDEVMVNDRHPGEVNQRKVPRRIIRKSSIAKGNLEGPRFSRTLPSVSSALSSVQGCSEGAIAFSQRQMQDMETLAEKLMKELKSMKEIVEQKLLFEAYRNASLRNDADEVKLAITNATKVEDMGRRWMSMISRDCTRFCKIMKMTPESTPASEDCSPREKRKIRFADEAGGQLCHVKYFDDDVAAPQADSDVAKQI